MLGSTYDRENCSAARTLEIIGERWSVLIIRDALFRGVTRFTDFQRSLGLATNVLAARLERFVDAGLMTRHPYTNHPGQYEYRLTDKGRDLQPVVIALTGWGDRWSAPHGQPVLYQHNDCGGAIGQVVRCSACGDMPTAADVVVRPGPGSRPAPRR